MKFVLPDGKRVGIPFGFDKLLNHIDAAYPGHRANIKKFLDSIAQLKLEISRLPTHIRWWHFFTHELFSRTTIRLRNKTLQQVFDECGLSKEVQGCSH